MIIPFVYGYFYLLDKNKSWQCSFYITKITRITSCSFCISGAKCSDTTLCCPNTSFCHFKGDLYGLQPHLCVTYATIISVVKVCQCVPCVCVTSAGLTTFFFFWIV